MMTDQLSTLRRVLLIILLVSVFFEGSGFSVELLGVRIRSVQVFEVAFILLLQVFAFAGRWRWRQSPIDTWLAAYLAVNVIAIARASWKARSIKIALLLISLALLYWLFYQLLRTKKDVLMAFNTFLLMGVLQIGYGLYQVLAGIMNHYFALRLPVGYLGTVHEKFIGSVWGRPYGTMVEPDLYGALCMMYALVFFSLYYSSPSRGKRSYLAGALISLLGLYLSFVRAAWMVFILVFVLMIVLKKKWRFFRFSWKSMGVVLSGVLAFHLLAFQTIPPMRDIVRHRLSTAASPATEKGLSSAGPSNIRLMYMKISWQATRQSPLIGNGPGSFASSYLKQKYPERESMLKKARTSFPHTNPNMLLTVFEDTGIIGLVLFLIIVGRIIHLNFKLIPRAYDSSAAAALALFVGLASLFMSYLLTTGFWLPTTWVFLGLNLGSLGPWQAKEGEAGPPSSKLCRNS